MIDYLWEHWGVLHFIHTSLPLGYLALSVFTSIWHNKDSLNTSQNCLHLKNAHILFILKLRVFLINSKVLRNSVVYSLYSNFDTYTQYTQRNSLILTKEIEVVFKSFPQLQSPAWMSSSEICIKIFKKK